MSSDDSTRVKERTRTADSKERFRFEIERVFNVTTTKYPLRKEIRRRIMLLISYRILFLSLSRFLAFYFLLCILSHFISTSLHPLVAFLPQQNNDCHFRAAQQRERERDVKSTNSDNFTNFALGEVVVRHKAGKRASERVNER